MPLNQSESTGFASLFNVSAELVVGFMPLEQLDRLTTPAWFKGQKGNIDLAALAKQKAASERGKRVLNTFKPLLICCSLSEHSSTLQTSSGPKADVTLRCRLQHLGLWRL